MTQNPNDFVALDDFMAPPDRATPEAADQAPVTPALADVGEAPDVERRPDAPAPLEAAAPKPALVDHAGAAEEDADTPAAVPVPAPARAGAHEPAARRAEASEALTPERLLPKRDRVPESGWRLFLYKVTGGVINIGDSRDVVERHGLEARVTARLPRTGMRSVAVVSGKGGVGKTTTTGLLGMSMASLRHDRTVAFDANPDAGSLAFRIERQSTATVWDVVESKDGVESFSDMSRLVSRDPTRLDVIVSENDSDRSRAFGGAEYSAASELLGVYYSVMVTDTGTDLTHDVYTEVLDRADCIVMVTGTRFDEAKVASMTLDRIAAMGHEDLVENAIVALVATTSPKVDVDALEQHFASRVASVIRVPHDGHLDEGSRIVLEDLKPATRRAGLKLAAAVIDQLSTDKH